MGTKTPSPVWKKWPSRPSSSTRRFLFSSRLPHLVDGSSPQVLSRKWCRSFFGALIPFHFCWDQNTFPCVDKKWPSRPSSSSLSLLFSSLLSHLLEGSSPRVLFQKQFTCTSLHLCSDLNTSLRLLRKKISTFSHFLSFSFFFQVHLNFWKTLFVIFRSEMAPVPLLAHTVTSASDTPVLDTNHFKICSTV